MRQVPACPRSFPIHNVYQTSLLWVEIQKLTRLSDNPIWFAGWLVKNQQTKTGNPIIYWVFPFLQTAAKGKYHCEIQNSLHKQICPCFIASSPKSLQNLSKNYQKPMLEKHSNIKPKTRDSRNPPACVRAWMRSHPSPGPPPHRLHTLCR